MTKTTLTATGKKGYLQLSLLARVMVFFGCRVEVGRVVLNPSPAEIPKKAKEAEFPGRVFT